MFTFHCCHILCIIIVCINNILLNVFSDHVVLRYDVVSFCRRYVTFIYLRIYVGKGYQLIFNRYHVSHRVKHHVNVAIHIHINQIKLSDRGIMSRSHNHLIAIHVIHHFHVGYIFYYISHVNVIGVYFLHRNHRIYQSVIWFWIGVRFLFWHWFRI